MVWIMKPERLVEPVPAPEFFVDGIGAVEECDGLVRVFYYANRTNLYGDEVMKQVEVILRRPLVSIQGSLAQAIGNWNKPPFVPYVVR